MSILYHHYIYFIIVIIVTDDTNDDDDYDNRALPIKSDEKNDDFDTLTVLANTLAMLLFLIAILYATNIDIIVHSSITHVTSSVLTTSNQRLKTHSVVIL